MAFSDYKSISQVQKEFGIKFREENFIVAQAIEPPAAFRDEFEFSRENIDVFTSEASRTDLIITPILREIYTGRSREFFEKMKIAQKEISKNPQQF